MSDTGGDNSGKVTPPGGSEPARSPLVLAGVGIVLVAVIVGSYFLRNGRHGQSPAASAPGASVTESTPGTAALANRNVCQATLDRARDFGVVEPATALVSDDPQSTSTQNRVICSAKNGDVTYKMTVDQICSNMADFKCLDIWNVTDSTGATLYQHREFLPPED